MVVGMGVGTKTHGPGSGIQTRACAGRASYIGQVFHFRLGKGLFTAFVFIVGDRVVVDLALVLGEFHARAHAIRAPAVFAVVRE